MAYLTDINVKQSFSPIYHKPFEQFSPAYQLDYSYAPNIQIDSPGATGTTITTKKESAQTPYIGGTDLSETQQQDIMGPILLLGILGIGGWIAVNYLKRKK